MRTVVTKSRECTEYVFFQTCWLQNAIRVRLAWLCWQAQKAHQPVAGMSHDSQRQLVHTMGQSGHGNDASAQGKTIESHLRKLRLVNQRTHTLCEIAWLSLLLHHEASLSGTPDLPICSSEATGAPGANQAAQELAEAGGSDPSRSGLWSHGGPFPKLCPKSRHPVETKCSPSHESALRVNRLLQALRLAELLELKRRGAGAWPPRAFEGSIGRPGGLWF